MGILTKNADFTDRDFPSLLARVRSLVRSVFPQWSDESTAQFANLLVEMYCFIGDVLGYYQDNQAREAFTPTAQLRKNMLALVRAIGFTPAGAGAATTTVTFTLAAPVGVGRTVTFNPPTTPTPTNPTTAKTIDIDNPVAFQLLTPLVIGAGGTSGSATFENSALEGPETFLSSGLPNQSFTLAKTPFLDGSGSFVASDGTYLVVDSFLQSTPTDKHVVITVDENDQATFTFGNGVNGAVPVGTITVNYKTGGGVAGMVAANSLKLEGNYVDSAGDPITVTVTNTPGSGGDDRDSVEEIREKAPESLRVLTRTVAREDYEIAARQVAGVERALALTRNEDTSIAENSTSIVVVPTGTGFPSMPLRNAVITKVTVDLPCPATFAPAAVTPTYLDIGLQANLFLRPGFVALTVRDQIRQLVKDFFNPKATQNLIDQLGLKIAAGQTNPLIDFGFNLKASSGAPAGEIALSDLFEMVASVDGIREIGDALTDFRASAYRVVASTLAYSGGGFPAVLVQALAHTDVAVGLYDFPRLKTTVLGGSVLDIDLTIDGVNYPPS
jgi:hypothetical protein